MNETQLMDEEQFKNGARQWLLEAIVLTEAGDWDRLLDDYYDISELDRAVALDLIEANRYAHLDLMRATLDNEAGWFCMGPILTGLAPTFHRMDYLDDGIMFRLVDGEIRCQPNTDSLLRQRDRRPLSTEAERWADQIELHPQLISDLLRLGVGLTSCIGKSGVEALLATEWPDAVSLASVRDDYDELDTCDGPFVYGWTPQHSDNDHIPEGFEKHGSVISYGNDCYSYFGLVHNQHQPEDPLIAIVDHEEEGEAPSLMLASLLFWKLELLDEEEP